MFKFLRPKSRELAVIDNIVPLIDLNQPKAYGRVYVLTFKDPFREPIYCQVLDEKEGYVQYSYIVKGRVSEFKTSTDTKSFYSMYKEVK